MRGKPEQTGQQQDCLQRDERLGAVLRSAAPAHPLLSWDKIEQLVASAPPVHRPWYAGLLASPAPLRYALAPMLVLCLAGGTLWVMPAQSEQAGTIVSTVLPVAWQDDNGALTEVQAAGQREFAALHLPADALRIFTVERGAQDELVLTMLEATQPQAAAVMTRLAQHFPLLSADKAQYIDVKSDPAENRLLQLVEHVQQAAGVPQDETRVAHAVLKALDKSGLDSLDITKLERLPDGSLVIELEAAFSVKVDGHMQEKLTARDKSASTPGKADAGQLLQALDAAQPAGR